MAVVNENKCFSQTPEKHSSAIKTQYGHQCLHKRQRVSSTVKISGQVVENNGPVNKPTAQLLLVLR